MPLSAFAHRARPLARARTKEREPGRRYFFNCVISHPRRGVAGLYRGAGARVAFFAPSTAIAMASFEHFKTALIPS